MLTAGDGVSHVFVIPARAGCVGITRTIVGAHR